MKRAWFRRAVGFASVLLLAGCSTRYVESETPPGMVPPAPVPMSQVDPYSTARDRGEIPTEAPPPLGASAAAVAASETADVQARFGKAYAARGRPRIAIFVNRELSGTVEEWNVALGVSRSRSVDEMRLEEDGGWTSREGLEGEVDNLHLGRAADGSRRAPAGEAWVWQFEDGFMQPFLEVPSRLVDRATILRLTAADSVRTGPEYAGIATKKVEIDALRAHADLLVELLVTPQAGSPTGYRFKASVKEVRTGALVANVTDDGSGAGPGRFQAGASGYERALPSIDEVSRSLALDVMGELGARWK